MDYGSRADTTACLKNNMSDLLSLPNSDKMRETMYAVLQDVKGTGMESFVHAALAPILFCRYFSTCACHVKGSSRYAFAYTGLNNQDTSAHGSSYLLHETTSSRLGRYQALTLSASGWETRTLSSHPVYQQSGQINGGF